MKIVIPVCILCEATDVCLWTLDDGEAAAVTYVCTEHAEPLRELVRASQYLPVDMQTPLPQRRKVIGSEVSKEAAAQAAEIARIERERKRRMTPLLDWTPPAWMPNPPVHPEPPSPEARAAFLAEQEAQRIAREAQADAVRAEKEAERQARAAAKAKREAAEELVVRDARAEGKTWKQIGDMLGTTQQSVWSRYHLRYKDKGSPEQVSLPLPVDAGVDVPVDLPDDAPEMGAGGHGHNVVFSGGTEVHDTGLQPLEGSDTLDGVKKKGGRSRKRARGNAVVNQIEVA
ncbi:MAG: hypothetical protein ACXVYB_00070 [Arthrobacter sp.]